MKFLDYCKQHQLDPFLDASKEAHKEAQKAENRKPRKPPVFHWLRALRSLDKEARATASRLQQAEQLDGQLQATGKPPADLRALEALADAARDAFDLHASQHPALRDEFLARAAAHDLKQQCKAQRAIIAKLEAKPPTAPAEPLDLNAEARRLDDIATARRADADAVIAGATELDRQWQAMHADPHAETNWLARDNLRKRLERAAPRVARATRMADSAEEAATRAHARAAAAYAKHERALAAYREHPVSLALARTHLATLQAQLTATRDTLPATPAAPLTEQRERFGEPVTPHLYPALHRRYDYVPATSELRLRRTGETLHGASFQVGGIRISRKKLIEVLCPVNVYDMV